MNVFRSIFAEKLAAYVKLRRGLGSDFEKQAELLQAFDRYVNQRGYEGPLTQELALAFVTDNPNDSINRQARRYSVIRHFYDYLATFDPRTPLLDPKALCRTRARPQAHIYTDEEMARLLHEAINTTPLVRGMTLYTIVGLAVSTGLRISEVVRLDKADVDLETGMLVVRRTKFNKDRLVPMHPTTLKVMRNYAAVRDAAFLDCECPAFFLNMRSRRFVRNTLQCAFWNLTRRASLRGPKGKGPGFHCLRHTFAVNRLVVWYKEGKDVQAMLPALATYMGHVHYTSTAYYLTATAELLGLAAGRYHSWLQQGRCGHE